MLTYLLFHLGATASGTITDFTSQETLKAAVVERYPTAVLVTRTLTAEKTTRILTAE